MTEAQRFQWQDKAGLAIFVLAATLLLAPGLGVYSDRMLQDTFKSMLLSFGAIIALGLWVSSWRHASARVVVWHDVLALPLLLAAYALGSMVWSHRYLAGVEVARWLVLSLLVWLCLNLASLARTRVLLVGLHLGAVVAATWAVAQFWFDLSLFAQGPNPASTFVNRNFLAEFLVASVPLGVWLWTQARGSARIGALAASNGWVVLALLMTGTRSALVALALLVPILVWWAWAWRARFSLGQWSRAQRLWALMVVTVVVFGLGQLPCGNAQIRAEHGAQPVSALERALHRTATVASPGEYQSGSFSMRVRMWESSARMIVAHPWWGVGAGAWEVHVPLFQDSDSAIESDYYAHNEPLQLLAEYGAAGWLALGLLLTYGAVSILRSLRLPASADPMEAPLRLAVLASLGALAFVSCAGFPLHLAATGAEFAVCLGLVAASDARLGPTAWWTARRVELPPAARPVGYALCSAALAVALAASVVAAMSEYFIVRAVSAAIFVSRSGVPPDDPSWARMRQNMLDDMRQGIAWNPHYRKITPLLADQLALWGDWKNAIWIWESVAASRPYVTGLHVNIARGYLRMGQLEPARAALERAAQIHPQASVVRVVHALYLTRSGQLEAARSAQRQLLSEGILDLDLVNASYQVGIGLGDLGLSEQAMELRLRYWPAYTIDSWLLLGAAYHSAGAGHAEQALNAYRTALQQAPEPLQALVRKRIPAELLPRLGSRP